MAACMLKGCKLKLTVLLVRGRHRLELAAFASLRNPGFDFAALPEQEIRDCLAQARMDNEMHAVCEGRVKAAQPLILTAGAGFETVDTLLDAMLNRGIVTNVEMQKGQVR